MLNLGAVKDLAQVSINGKDLGILWKAPYQVDATGALKAGANRVEIQVTNEWTNRQIGDRLGPPEKRVLAPAGGPAGGGRGGPPAAAGRGGAPAGGGGGFGRGPQTPLESGLLGPVTLVSVAAR
jgi:hypothetical protein